MSEFVHPEDDIKITSRAFAFCYPDFNPNCWIPASNGDIPFGAVVGGHDGEDLFIARASHEGSLTPGKLMASYGCCYIPWGGAEHGKQEYEVLCGCTVNWVYTSGGEIPDNAILGGKSENGESLFIGRVSHGGSLIIGKVQASHGVCYISYDGKELGFDQYEVICS